MKTSPFNATETRDARIAQLIERGIARAERHAHGTRLRYVVGRCRCDPCRKANSAYENERQKLRRAGDWNGTVDAKAARTHLLALRRRGVGRRMVQQATDIADSILVMIINGQRTRIRARTSKAILAVTIEMRGDAALIDSAPSWRLIDELLEEGYTIGRIATEFGYARPYLQLKRDKPITVRNAARIAAVHRKLTT